MMFVRSFRKKLDRRPERGFTLIELLVVIAIISILAALLVPALREARDSGLKSGCMTRMRSWGTAIYQYAADRSGEFPLYAKNPPPQTQEASVWVNTLASYLGGVTIVPDEPSDVQRAKRIENDKLEVRRCTTGEAFIGCHYSNPFRWLGVTHQQRLDFIQIRKPGGWIAFMDTYDGWGMYTPVNWRYNVDFDGDGIKDSNSGGGFLYNWAMPRVHLEGMNVIMIDGHAEWMAFEDFLNPDHPNWTDEP
jgi:prepilin-type N-terminal cleavage/methylation domain-containing protein